MISLIQNTSGYNKEIRTVETDSVPETLADYAAKMESVGSVGAAKKLAIILGSAFQCGFMSMNYPYDQTEQKIVNPLGFSEDTIHEAYIQTDVDAGDGSFYLMQQVGFSNKYKMCKITVTLDVESGVLKPKRSEMKTVDKDYILQHSWVLAFSTYPYGAGERKFQLPIILGVNNTDSTFAKVYVDEQTTSAGYKALNVTVKVQQVEGRVPDQSSGIITEFASSDANPKLGLFYRSNIDLNTLNERLQAIEYLTRTLFSSTQEKFVAR